MPPDNGASDDLVRLAVSDAVPAGTIYLRPGWTPDWGDADEVYRWVHGFGAIRTAASGSTDVPKPPQ